MRGGYPPPFLFAGFFECRFFCRAILFINPLFLK
jgi:hypothetical protein